MSFIRWRSQRTEAFSLSSAKVPFELRNLVAQDNLIARGWPLFHFSPSSSCTAASRNDKPRGGEKKQFLWRSIVVFFRVCCGFFVCSEFCPDFCYEVSNSDGAGKRHFFRIAEFGANAIKSRRSQDGNPLAIKKSWATRFLNSLVTSVRTKVAGLCTLTSSSYKTHNEK